MRMVDLIRKKRDGSALSEAEIRWMIAAYTAGEIPDYQMAAFTMATVFRSMTGAETAVLTDAMMRSGDTVDLSDFGTYSVDKHSTGGVGDKTTLIVAPLVASLGGKLAKMSGRGLGHTGGTVDKLEAIPGFRTTLTAEEFRKQVHDVGVAVVGQSGNLTPADKKLYALRDVTATVDSIPLIASSVMSKKLAAGSKSIVLDVKVGSGAFMKTLQDARTLAETMVGIGKAWGRNVTAVLSNMDEPLGFCIGNALEVEEAVDILQGKGCPDLRELCLALSAEMLALVHGWSAAEAAERAAEALDSGAAFRTVEAWITAQGGDLGRLYDRRARYVREVRMPADRGYVVKIDAQKIGETARVLGAGRAKKEDVIEPTAGVRLVHKTGSAVQAGDVLATLYTNRPEALEQAEQMLLAAYTFGSKPPEKQPLVYGVIR